MLLVKEDEDQKRVIAPEDIERIQSHREQVVNTLRAFPCFDISKDGKHLECRCCEKNWEKARFNFSENRGKIKITEAIGGHAKRHVIGPKHSACRRAEGSFQIHREYYDEIFASTEKRIASMTDNVIRLLHHQRKYRNAEERRHVRLTRFMYSCSGISTPLQNNLGCDRAVHR